MHCKINSSAFCFYCYGPNVGGRTLPPLLPVIGGRAGLCGRFIGGKGLKLPPAGGLNDGGGAGGGIGDKSGCGGGDIQRQIFPPFFVSQ